LLLESGALINAEDGGLGSALQVAVQFLSEDMVRILLENGADVNTWRDDSVAPLYTAAMGCSAETVWSGGRY